MRKPDEITDAWCREFKCFSLNGGEINSPADEELMDLVYSNIELALLIVLEIVDCKISDDALGYLGAQHFEEICVHGSKTLFASLTDKQLSAVKQLLPHVWWGRVHADMKMYLGRLNTELPQ